MLHPLLLAGVALAAAAPLLIPIGTTREQPGQPIPGRIVAGTYRADPDHTQVAWEVNHMGFSILQGMFPAPEGTLAIDPHDLAASKVDVTVRIDQAATTSAQFASDLKAAKLFDATRFPTARFVSTRIVRQGADRASIDGNLTIKGISRKVTLDATFVGAGTNPNTHQPNIGFAATGRIKRSDFGLGLIVPVVSDEVRLHINAAFVGQ